MPVYYLEASTKTALMECLSANGIKFYNESGNEVEPIQPCHQSLGHSGHVIYHANKLVKSSPVYDEDGNEVEPVQYYSGYHATVGLYGGELEIAEGVSSVSPTSPNHVILV